MKLPRSWVSFKYMLMVDGSRRQLVARMGGVRRVGGPGFDRRACQVVYEGQWHPSYTSVFLSSATIVVATMIFSSAHLSYHIILVIHVE